MRQVFQARKDDVCLRIYIAHNRQLIYGGSLAREKSLFYSVIRVVIQTFTIRAKEIANKVLRFSSEQKYIAFSLF